MMEFHDRYVNNRLLSCISRPQHENSCSLTSLTAVFNYLYAEQLGIKSSGELASSLGIEPPGEFGYGPGNETILKWFTSLCSHYGVSGQGRIYLRDEEMERWDANAEVFAGLKDSVRSANRVLVYHKENHYNLVVGYFEHGVDPDFAYDTGTKLRRWVILGEHSEYNPIPAIIRKALRALPEKVLSEDTYNLIMESAVGTPVWSRRWRSIRHDLINTPKHCILSFTS